MKPWFAALVLLPLALPSAAAQRLLTASFDIRIEVRCPEGVVGCPDVRYVGVHRKSGRALHLVGQEWHTRCTDGETPCRFLGYRFDHGTSLYLVSDDGTLTVRQGDVVLLQEQGAWQ